jgi:hypothetical protein
VRCSQKKQRTRRDLTVYAETVVDVEEIELLIMSDPALRRGA